MKNQFSLSTGLRNVITFSIIGTFVLQMLVSLAIANQFLLFLVFLGVLYFCANKVYKNIVLLNGLYTVDLKKAIDEFPTTIHDHKKSPAKKIKVDYVDTSVSK